MPSRVAWYLAQPRGMEYERKSGTQSRATPHQFGRPFPVRAGDDAGYDEGGSTSPPHGRSHAFWIQSHLGAVQGPQPGEHVVFERVRRFPVAFLEKPVMSNKGWCGDRKDRT